MVATRKTTKAAVKPPSEAPRGYAVISEADEHGQVWHYPVRSGAAGAPEQWTPIFFMAPTGPAKQQRRAPVRFKSRARAVRFAVEDAAAEREMLRELRTAFG